MFALTVTHLRFVCEALTAIHLPRYEAGSRLRGALGNVMRRAYCAHALTPQPPLPKSNSRFQERGSDLLPSPDNRFSSLGEGHRGGGCPVCWLLAANEQPGKERRGYALRPMLDPPEVIQPGQRFSFGLTLFGDAQRFLPYFILAVPEMGRIGVGAGYGKFALRQVWADDPLTGQPEPVLAEGDSLVHVPAPVLFEERVQIASDHWMHAVEASGQVRLLFLTPMRLIEAGRLLKSPDFGVLFKRLLERIDELSVQFGGGAARPLDEVRDLQTLADRVRLMEAQTRWIEVKSGSTRRGQSSWISGFVGEATYSAPPEVWKPLLPWLIWGESTQVGRSVVKGNGWYEMMLNGER